MFSFLDFGKADNRSNFHIVSFFVFVKIYLRWKSTEIVYVFDPSEEVLHCTENYKSMSLYTGSISPMIETYVERKEKGDDDGEEKASDEI